MDQRALKAQTCFEVEAQTRDQKLIKTIAENDENYQGFLRWNCEAKKRLLTANTQIVKIQSNVLIVENAPPLPLQAFQEHAYTALV